MLIKVLFDVERSKGISKISSNVIRAKLPSWRLFFDAKQLSVKLLQHLWIPTIQINNSMANETPQDIICNNPLLNQNYAKIYKKKFDFVEFKCFFRILATLIFLHDITSSLFALEVLLNFWNMTVNTLRPSHRLLIFVAIEHRDRK